MPKTKREIQKEYELRTGYAAQIRYRTKNVKRFQIDCVKTTEQDIIDKLESVPNKSGYIKSLIRADIAKSE